MTDSGTFWMARLKLERAESLINDVAEELERYRQNPPIEHRIVQEADGGFAAETEIQGGPYRAAPIIGDVIHNLRASLDLMASELARMNKQSDKNVYFPIADAENNLGTQIARKNFDRCGPDAVALLKILKPYRGGNLALRAMHDLDIEDKHTALVPTSSQIATSVKVPFENGILLPHLATVSHDPDSIKLVFPAESPFAGDEVVPTLELLLKLTESILEEFTRMVAARK